MVDGLFVHPNVDVYVTGSNAYMLSGELATLLSGRYIEVFVLPLSFAEYYDFFQDEAELSRVEKFERFTRVGGFPEVANLVKAGISGQIPDYLSAIYNTVVEKDIISRYNFSPNPVFDNVLSFAFDSVGSLVSPNNIKNKINAERDAEKKVSLERIDRYLLAFRKSFIIFQAKRYDIKGKNLLKTLDKYYAVDTGLRNYLLGKESDDTGHLLENLVYLELLRRGYRIWVGKVDDKEVDFVARTPEGYTEYYQVADSVLDAATRIRELASFAKIGDHNPKYLITRDPGDASHNGIRQINIIDWLLGTA